MFQINQIIVILAVLLICSSEFLSHAATIEIQKPDPGSSSEAKATVVIEKPGILQPDYDINRWPYVVSVQNNDTHVCVGCILEGRAILTSSKCVRNVNPKDLTIEMSSSKWGKGEEYRIAKSIYDIDGPHNDLAVLFLEKPIDRMKWYTINLDSHTGGYTIGFVFNWKRRDNSTLSKIYESPAYPGCLDNFKEMRGIFCAVTYKTGPCPGDLGSPLLFPYSKNPTVIGILSETSNCPQNIIFTDVGIHIEKINSLINSHLEEIKENEGLQPSTLHNEEERKPETTTIRKISQKEEDYDYYSNDEDDNNDQDYEEYLE